MRAHTHTHTRLFCFAFCFAGGNRICHAVPGAHEGGIFGLCVLRNGTIVTGGGRDRRVVLWGRDYQKLQENEVLPGGDVDFLVAAYPAVFDPVQTLGDGNLWGSNCNPVRRLET